MTESDSNSSWNAAKYQEKCEWDSSVPKVLEQLANCTIKKSYKEGQFDDADENGNFVTRSFMYFSSFLFNFRAVLNPNSISLKIPRGI